MRDANGRFVKGNDGGMTAKSEKTNLEITRYLIAMQVQSLWNLWKFGSYNRRDVYLAIAAALDVVVGNHERGEEELLAYLNQLVDDDFVEWIKANLYLHSN